jgi:hypothetical protein
MRNQILIQFQTTLKPARRDIVLALIPMPARFPISILDSVFYLLNRNSVDGKVNSGTEVHECDARKAQSGV